MHEFDGAVRGQCQARDTPGVLLIIFNSSQTGMAIAGGYGMGQTCAQDLIVPVYYRVEIEKRVAELAAAIDARYGTEAMVAICVLKGAFIFFSDLVRQIRNPNLELDFVRLSSYGKSSTSTGHIVFNKDAEIDIRDKHVLIVEDIVDSGQTMFFLCEQFRARKPLSISIVALVDKHERRLDTVKVDYAGFTLDKGFLVGYGMDYAEKYRSLPDICEIRCK